MSEPKFTVQLTSPTVARRCIRCGQLITFAWDAFPVVNNRREMRTVATFYVHPDIEACRADIERASILAAGEAFSPHDIGLARAALLRELATQAQDAMLAGLTPEPEPEPEPKLPNYAKRTRGARERPYGGLL